MTDLARAEMLLAKARFSFLPWQVKDAMGRWQTVEDDSFSALGSIFFDFDDAEVRFETCSQFQWPYRTEDREGVPVWVYSNGFNCWIYFRSIELAYAANRDMEFTGYLDMSRVLSADPRNLQEPPRQ